MTRASRLAFAGVFLGALLAGCTHRVDITSPEKPIAIEMTIRVQQEILVVSAADPNTR